MDARRCLFAVGPVAAAAGLGGLAARRAPQTYEQLRRPRWAPPASAFAPVWSALYAGIGMAGWRLWDRSPRRGRMLHLTQLTLNAAWPTAFFAVCDKRASLLVITLLDAAITTEILTLRRDDPVAALLLVPYLAWSGFATALNIAVSDPAATLSADGAGAQPTDRLISWS